MIGGGWVGGRSDGSIVSRSIFPSLEIRVVENKEGFQLSYGLVGPTGDS